MYGKMAESTKSQIIGNVWEFLEHWCCDEVRIERDELSGSSRREEVKEISRTTTKVRTLPSIKKFIISEDEEWSRKYLTDVPGSVHGY